MRRPLAALATAALALTLTACGGSDDSSGSAAGSSGSTGAFPVSIENKFGTTEIPSEPQRIVTIGFNDADFVLALGGELVGERELIGDYDATQRPWAQDVLPADDVPTVGSGELNLEAIAALAPDLIVGVYSFIDQGTYDQLSAIAPTLAQTDEYADGATPWQEQTLLTGRALGVEDAAQQLVDDVEGQFAQAVEENPDFAGQSIAVDLTGLGGSGHYLLGQDDLRTQFFADLGFEVPEASQELSAERLDLLDADVLVENGYDQAALDADTLLAGLGVVTEDRTVLLGQYSSAISAAVGFGSPLSLPYLLEQLVGPLAAAADADPSTVVEQPES
ncbi:iron complex transport system substrate-binding protein [Klenkia marina]|uniref:Iron complex transport system substrate-binding protein n=1 Tax=Klenkia marina TaxID=1960309 RepID=A0A1G4XD95_9ACTN|nr:iron-siderophore ABC transporter substrate-binding protein [Klenkia marina]SCX39126.1 iron complex transport system substrate-binding protein [Klenkia marina]